MSEREFLVTICNSKDTLRFGTVAPDFNTLLQSGNNGSNRNLHLNR